MLRRRGSALETQPIKGTRPRGRTETEDRALAAELDGDARPDVVILNYANADMVGHTGNFEATVACIETLDACLGRTLEAARAHGYDVLITADQWRGDCLGCAGGRQPGPLPACV